MAQWYKWDETKLIGHIRPCETDSVWLRTFLHLCRTQRHCPNSRGTHKLFAHRRGDLSFLDKLTHSAWQFLFNRRWRTAEFTSVFALWKCIYTTVVCIAAITRSSFWSSESENCSRTKKCKSWVQQAHCINFTCRDIRTRLRDTVNKHFSLLLSLLFSNHLSTLGYRDTHRPPEQHSCNFAVC